MDLQGKLANALVERNPDAFKEALVLGANPNIPDSKNISIYETSLATEGCATFIELCLQYGGSSVHYVNQKLKKAAINYATDSRDSNNLQVLLRRNVKVNQEYNSLTPLNSLAKNAIESKASQITQCTRILLEYGASPNTTDNNGYPPLYYILVNQSLETAQKKQLFELYFKQPSIYIGKELRDEFQKRMPDLTLPAQGAESLEGIEEQLLTELDDDNAERFQELLLRRQGNYIDYGVYVAKCIQNGSHRVLKSLLHQNVNVIARSQTKQTYLEIAVVSGNWAALGMLLNTEQLQLEPNVEMLNNVIARLNETPARQYCNYMKCFEILLQCDQRIDVNKMDKSDRTPLHYAILYNNAKAVGMLLDRGAYLGVKSQFRELPILCIEPGLLEQYFNNCITAEGSRVDEDFKILISYKNFKLPIDMPTTHNEMDPIVAIGESKKHRHLLKHPLLSTLITLKWQNICSWHYWYVVVTAIFNLCFVLNIAFAADLDGELELLRKTICGIFIGCLVVSEAIKLYVSRVFFCSTRIFNILHILMLISSSIFSDPKIYTHRVIGAFTIIAIGVQLTTLIRWVPRFSLSLYVLMLKKVTLTYLECCIPFSILIISFGLGFYVLNIHSLAEKTVIEAIFKTTAMATGEFEEGSINYQDNMFTHLFLTLFVILITIVLMNLLSGLAFGDAQAIRAEAEVNSLMCFVNLLSGYEKLLTGYRGCLKPLLSRLHLFGETAIIPSKVCAFPNKNMSLTRKRTKKANYCVELNPLQTLDEEIIIKFSQKSITQVLEVIDRKSTQ